MQFHTLYSRFSSKQIRFGLAGLALTAALTFSAYTAMAAGDTVVFADFEGAAYGAWAATGDAFGSGPAPGTLPGQMAVTGFLGKALVSSYHGGDRTTGRLLSPPFTVTRDYVAFRIGGGGFAEQTCINLLIDGKAARTAEGPNIAPGGSESLHASGWDVRDLRGRTAQIEIVDAATGGWGHINVDQIEFTDTKPTLAPVLRRDVTRTIRAEKRWLNFPVKDNAPRRRVTVRADDKNFQTFEIPLADDGKGDWSAPLDVSDWHGKPLTVVVDTLPADSRALETVTNTDKITGSETLYREVLRPQFHFSAQRGWLNDPNGLVFYNGEYHLFFQHSPFDWDGSVKYWGQAVSPDLVHWTEIGEALAPDSLGAMWSGSAVVDWQNTSGFGKDGKPPVVLIYTAAGSPFTQCLAYSTDGRKFTKYAGNPVVANITDGNRDPKVFWHTPTKRWVQVLYVQRGDTHTVQFLTSPNLREWTPVSATPGRPGTNFLYECPDFFPLPLDNDPKNLKWVLTGADSAYSVGSFDGTTFMPQTPPLTGHRGRGFYAAQTYSDEPRNRRIQIGWWQTETRGMPFNQSMSLPLELHLVSTPDGPRLTWTPIKELETLREKAHRAGPVTLRAGESRNPLSAIHGALLEIRAEFAPSDDSMVTITVRGVPVIYDSAKGELTVNGHHAPAPLQNRKMRLTLYADRTGLEVFAGDGLTFVPMPVNLKQEDKSLSVTVDRGAAAFDRLDVYELRGTWGR